MACSRNHLLAALKPSDQALISQELQDVTLMRGQLLFEAGEAPSHVYFPYAGAMISLVLPARDGGMTETVSVGVEGAAGLGVDPQSHTVPSYARAIVQMAGAGARIGRDRLAEAAASSSTLNAVLARFTEAMMSMALQSIACNARHPVRSRLARWLLIACDRADPRGGAISLPLTQEFLAEMLGVRRATVGEAILAFQSEGALTVRRGRILIDQRGRLERMACECYGSVRQRYAELLPDAHQDTARRNTTDA